MRLFTKANAAEYARRAVRSRLNRLQAEREFHEATRLRLELSESLRIDSLELRTARTRKQIDLIDRDIENPETSPEIRVKLISAKTRLWSLAYGNMEEKPRGNPPCPREAPPEPVIERILAKADTPTGSGLTENGES